MYKPETRFLIVDDIPTMRKAIKSILQNNGYSQFVEAADGKIALEKLKEYYDKNTPIDFIFSDWSMPNLSGIDLLKTCKKDNLFKSIPFILLSSESEQSNIVEALKAGVSEYIVKPFNPQLLKEKLEKVYLRNQTFEEKKVS